MNSRYVEWLQRQGVPLFKARDMYWQLYQGALVPASTIPCYIKLSHDDAKALLKDSGAWFIRYSSEPSEEETEWWYIVCDKYDSKLLSKKTRYNINRGNRMCSVQQIDAVWLAEHGYECYTAAYARYNNANPVSEEVFRNNILKTVEGPFEYWGVFVKDHLAGYCQCIIEKNIMTTNISKYHPAYLKWRSTYALIYSMINHYVVEHKMTICSGSRSIAHDTSYQKFLIKLGYKRQFCHLNIVYRPWLEFVVQTFFPWRKLIAVLPNRGPIHKMQSILFQEELKRKCLIS